jgi:hypothetical protein
MGFPMSKHTPGRWSGHNNGFKIWIKSDEVDGEFVADLSDQTDKGKAWADAHLIAAAPDLLYQLIIAREFIKATKKDWQDTVMAADSKQALQDAVNRLLENVDLAIAKAEGRDE